MYTCWHDTFCIFTPFWGPQKLNSKVTGLFLQQWSTIARCHLQAVVAWPCNSHDSRLVTERSWVQLPAIPLLRNDSGLVVHTHLPQRPNSII